MTLADDTQQATGCAPYRSQTGVHFRRGNAFFTLPRFEMKEKSLAPVDTGDDLALTSQEAAHLKNMLPAIREIDPGTKPIINRIFPERTNAD